MSTETHHDTTLLGRFGLPPAEIERLSLARLEAQAGTWLPDEPGARAVVRRMLYAAGDPALAPAVRVHPRAVATGTAALRRGAPLIVDVRMVAAAIRQDVRERWGCPVLVALDETDAARLAARDGITRSAAAFRALAPRLAGTVVAIGNAPTALLALLDLIDEGFPPPALIVGLPVGLVAAAESKDELVSRDVPYVTVLGTRGGSPLAAAAINALLELTDGQAASSELLTPAEAAT